jgi:hypothetical protein
MSLRKIPCALRTHLLESAFVLRKIPSAQSLCRVELCFPCRRCYLAHARPFRTSFFPSSDTLRLKLLETNLLSLYLDELMKVS